MARRMVTQWGMSETLGTMVYSDEEGEGPNFVRSISEATMQQVDAEVRRIIDQQYKVARDLIESNRDKMEVMAQALLDWETIDADQINDIMDGKPPRPPRPSTATAAPPPPPQAPSAPATSTSKVAT